MPGIFDELGVRPVLNAQGNRTMLGGATPSGEVRALMDSAEEYYVDLSELMDNVAERIAAMLDVEAALVTSGCSAALAVGAAACMTGDDQEKIDLIPDITGMRYEFIIQRQLRVRYDRCVTIPGGKLVEVGDLEETRPEQIEEAIGPNTAGIHYLAPGDRLPGAVPLEEVIRIGHSRNIPIIVDAAGEVYPTDKLSRYVKMGADLVAYGAKYFGAVNSSGLLTGRRDLLDVARKHSFIGFEATESRAFGRPMKVDRQEVVAVYGALREWLSMNHEDRFAAYEVRISNLRDDLRDLEHVELLDSPEEGPIDGLTIKLDVARIGKSAGKVVDELKAGNPSIWVRSPYGRPDYYPPGADSFTVRMPQLKEAGEHTIAARIKVILSS